MKNRFYRMSVLLTCMAIAVLTLCAGVASAEEKYTEFLGKPFPGFIVTDTEGNSLTLTGALKDHEAVLINFWATWCVPCQREFPFLNDAYEKYGDRVAFIALSAWQEDTIEMLAEYRTKNNILFSMGLDEGQELYNYIYGNGYPATVIVDRFGNAVFYHDSAFGSEEDVKRVLEVFLGDSYTQSEVLEKIPREASTRAFPVSTARALYPEGGNFRKVLIRSETIAKPVTCWIVPDESVIMRAEVAADDDVVAMAYWDSYSMNNVYLLEMLDPEAGVDTCRQSMPTPEDEHQYVQIQLYNGNEEEMTDNDVIAFLVKDEAGIELLTDRLKDQGYEGVSWEYADADISAENTLQAYIIHVVDQDNNPVDEVMVNFCTDKACVPNESDENGTVTFTGEPDVYHVQIVDAPDGYSWDEEYEMYTSREYGEWVLRIRKD